MCIAMRMVDDVILIFSHLLLLLECRILQSHIQFPLSCTSPMFLILYCYVLIIVFILVQIIQLMNNYQLHFQLLASLVEDNYIVNYQLHCQKTSWYQWRRQWSITRCCPKTFLQHQNFCNLSFYGWNLFPALTMFSLFILWSISNSRYHVHFPCSWFCIVMFSL